MSKYTMSFSGNLILLTAVCSTSTQNRIYTSGSKKVSGFAEYLPGNTNCHYRSDQTFKINEQLPRVPKKSEKKQLQKSNKKINQTTACEKEGMYGVEL